jgi:hypothetical protein
MRSVTPSKLKSPYTFTHLALTLLLTRAVMPKRVRWGGIRVHEFEAEHEHVGGNETGQENKRGGNVVERTQRDVSPKKTKDKDIWSAMMEKDIWQPGPWAGIWRPQDPTS